MVPAAVIGVVLLERFVLGPALSRLAESYATLSLLGGEAFAEIAAVRRAGCCARRRGVAVALGRRGRPTREIGRRGAGAHAAGRDLTRRRTPIVARAPDRRCSLALGVAGDARGAVRAAAAPRARRSHRPGATRAATGSSASVPASRLVARTELGPGRATDGVLATLAHVTDAHVLDASSPARVTFLDRLGAPFESTFRPQETLTAQVLAGAATRCPRVCDPTP